MAQQSFMVDDCPAQVIATIASTAITAGQIVYASGGTDEPFGTTVKGGYSYSDVEVKQVHAGTAAEGQYVIGVAMYDAASGDRLTVATEGLFLSPAEGATNITAGALLRPAYNETTAGVALWAATGTTAKATVAKAQGEIVGRALSGAATEGHYVLWKLRV